MGVDTISTGTVVSMAVTNAASTICAANTARKGVSLQWPITNTGRLFVSDSGTAPTTALYSFYLDPGDMWYDDRETPYTGDIKAISSIAGPEGVNVKEQT